MELLGRTLSKTAARAPNIKVYVALDQPNVNFNFAALAEEKYGWDALHPVAARLRALNNKCESDEESDSEAPTGEPIANGNTNGTNGDHAASTDVSQHTKKRRKRRKDMEYYDITDPFIDDDELVLQERTAASKDGFFVFQGPLVAEGEKVRIEKIDGGSTKRGAKTSRNTKVTKPKSVTTAPARTPRGKVSTTANDEETQSFVTPAPKQASKTTSSAAQSPDSSDTESEGDNTEIAERTAVGKVSEKPAGLSDKEDEKDILVAKTQNSSGPSGSDRSTSTDPKKSTTKTNGQKRPVELPTGSATSPTAARKRALSAAAATELRDLQKPPSAAALAKRAERARKKAAAIAAATAAAAAAVATPASLAPGSPQTPGSPSVSDSPQIPIFNSDGTIRKPRRPAREKTTEEKAELARKARETRERKKAEKLAQMEAEKAALLARAIANPLVDTTGISLSSVSPAPKASVSPSPAALTNILSAPAVAGTNDQTDVSMEMRDVKEESVRQAMPPSNPLSAILSSSAGEVERTESPSGRSMKLDAFLE